MRWNLAVLVLAAGLAPARPFVIHVVDGQTGRGVPLIELRAANERIWYTDSNGVAALSDPWAVDRDVWFQVQGDGYRFDGTAAEGGVVLRVRSGGRAQLRVTRTNIAERLYRITGAGIYGDSVTAGLAVPIRRPLLNGHVTGQDTAIAIPYRGRIYWFWGDTSGTASANFQVSGATSSLPDKGGLDPDRGIDLEYFVGRDGFSRRMLPLEGGGLVWLEGLMIVRDPKGEDRLVATYTRINDRNALEERGVAAFDDTADVFRVLARHPPERRHRSSHPVRVTENGRSWWYLYPTYRVPDDWTAIQDARTYEAFTCTAAGCGWRAGAPFVDGADEERTLIANGTLPAATARFPFIDVETNQAAAFGAGSIAWNDYRQRWIMIAGAWGNVYYSEAAAPEGPWRCARRIVRHDRYNFYNVVHHAFFNKDRGRVIYLEGTYSVTSIAGARPTPLYDYNQILYKLSLDDPRLQLPSECVGQP